MSAVYTKPLLISPSQAGVIGVPVPVGRVWVVRDIQAVVETFVAGMLIWVAAPGNCLFATHRFATSTDDFHWQWQGSQAILGGTTWTANVSAGSADIRITGYDFAA